MRATVLLVLSALSCTHDKRVPSAEDVFACEEHCHERFRPDGSPRPDVARALEAWNRGDFDASDSMWVTVFASEHDCVLSCGQ